MNQWLIDTLLMITLLMMIVLVLRRPVARLLGPSVAYWFWLLPAARLFMPSLEKAVAAPESSAAPLQAVIDSAPALLGAQSAVMAAPAASAINWLVVGLTVWLGGAAMLFVIQMIRYSDMRDELLANAEDLGAVEGISLISSDRVTGPLAFGLLHRFIVVPENFAAHFSKEESALAIEHELSHHKSGDLFVNLLAFAILCLNWFNPVAWMAWHAFRFDQEAACDARVLAGKDADMRQTYGRTLARAAQDDLPAFATAFNSPKTIIERLRRLTMNNDNSRRRITGRLGILAAIGFALPLTATIVPVWAHDPDDTAAATSPEKTEIRKEIRVYKISGDKDVTLETIDVVGDDLITRKIEKDGKTIIVKSNREINDRELEKIIKDADEMRIKAGESADQARKIRIEIEKIEDGAEGVTQKIYIRTKRKAHDGDNDGNSGAFLIMPPMPPMPSMPSQSPVHPKGFARIADILPVIEIAEIKGQCSGGKHRHISTSISNNNGQHSASIRVAICGRQNAGQARIEALQSLRDARDGLRSDSGMPKKIRAKVLRKLEANIRKLEADARSASKTV